MARTPTLRLVLLLVALAAWPLLASCGGSDSGDETAEATDTLTRRQKDSIVSTLPVPGAGAVGRAMRASDQARERARAHDTIR